MNDEHRLRETRVAGALSLSERADPVEELGSSACAENPSSDRTLASHCHERCPSIVHCFTPRWRCDAERALALIADEEQRRVRIVDEIAQVVQHAPAGEHAVRRDDHVRPRRGLDRAGSRHVVRDGRAGIVEGDAPSREHRARLLVEVLRMASVDRRGLRCHRRVEEQRQCGIRWREKPVELPHHVLGPPHRERRNEQDAARVVYRVTVSARKRDGLASGSCSRPPYVDSTST